MYRPYFKKIRSARKWIVTLFALVVALMASACQTNYPQFRNRENNQTIQPLPDPKGEVFGHGPIRVALLAPGTAPGNGARAAIELRNGALLALRDLGQDEIQLVIKDTAGQAASAQAKAAEAVKEGAKLILGPLFSANVGAASAIAQPSGIPMMAFSTDASIARRGVYLFSFTPRDDVQRIISYAASSGSRSIVAFLPNNAYGAVVEGLLRQTVNVSGVSVVHIARYERSRKNIETAALNAAKFYPGADSIYIPEGGAVPGAVLEAIKRLGISLKDKTIIGSGRWESINLNNPLLAGAIYPGRDTTRLGSFTNHYKATYGMAPGVNAALGYDAVVLAVKLVRRYQENAFRSGMIESPNGFVGVNGIFRFRKQGVAERGLAVYQAVKGSRKLLEPASESFGFLH